MDDTTDPTGDDINEAPNSLPVPTSGPSEAQLRANRNNALRSTGPRTPAGKSRSSANAVKHGLYATKCAAVEAGPYSEDPEEIASYLQSITDALEPRDAMEEGTASEIALIYLKERRLEGWESGQLADDKEIHDHDRVAAGTLARREAICAVIEWNQMRARTEEDPTGLELPWQAMAKNMQPSWPRIWIKDFWTEEITPHTPEDWRRAFEFLANHRFPGVHELHDWATEQLDEVEKHRHDVMSRARRNVAVNSIEIIERGTALRSRLTQEKYKLLALYEVFKARDLGAA